MKPAPDPLGGKHSRQYEGRSVRVRVSWFFAGHREISDWVGRIKKPAQELGLDDILRVEGATDAAKLPVAAWDPESLPDILSRLAAALDTYGGPYLKGSRRHYKAAWAQIEEDAEQYTKQVTKESRRDE